MFKIEEVLMVCLVILLISLPFVAIHEQNKIDAFIKEHNCSISQPTQTQTQTIMTFVSAGNGVLVPTPIITTTVLYHCNNGDHFL